MACTSAFIDILSTPPEMACFDAIRHEAASVFQTEADWGKVSSLHKLSRIDSALRESMRLNPLFGRGVMQQVMHKNGVTLPGPDGSHIPQGAWLGVSLTGITMDQRFYPNPQQYDPWRFSRARDQLAAAALLRLKEEEEGVGGGGGKSQTFGSGSGSDSTTNEKTFTTTTATTVGSSSSNDNDNDINNKSDDKKLNGRWLSTVDESFATFGFGKHSW